MNPKIGYVAQHSDSTVYYRFKASDIVVSLIGIYHN